MIVKGDMQVSVHDVYDWKKVADAHKEMEANKNSGKVGSAVRERYCENAECLLCVTRSSWRSGRLGSRIIVKATTYFSALWGNVIAGNEQCRIITCSHLRFPEGNANTFTTMIQPWR